MWCVKSLAELGGVEIFLRQVVDWKLLASYKFIPEINDGKKQIMFCIIRIFKNILYMFQFR